MYFYFTFDYLVYPRVKVRVEGEKAACQEDTTVSLLRVIQSCSIESNSSSKIPVKVNGSHAPHARITKSQNPHQLVPSIVKGFKESGKSTKHAEDDDRPNIRASLVPRPRAVLSSPDNDGMIGNINKRSRERKTILKTQSPSQGTPAARKPVTRSVSTGTAAGRAKTSKADSNSSNLKEKHLSGLKLSTQRFDDRKDKVSSMGI